jgi:hypothetical protein
MAPIAASSDRLPPGESKAQSCALATPERPPARAYHTVRARLWEGTPLFLASASLFVGAWAASDYHIRILSSPFPLWILLALDGVVAALVGAIALFVAEPDTSADDDPLTIRVSRVQWESLLRAFNGLEPPSEIPGPPTALSPPGPPGDPRDSGTAAAITQHPWC